MKTADDLARQSFERWIKERDGERLMGAYPNAFSDLRQLIAEEITSAVATARASAFTEAAKIANDYANQEDRMNGDEQQDIIDAARDIAAAIGTLASQAEEIPDAFPRLAANHPLADEYLKELNIISIQYEPKNVLIIGKESSGNFTASTPAIHSEQASDDGTESELRQAEMDDFRNDISRLELAFSEARAALELALPILELHLSLVDSMMTSEPSSVPIDAYDNGKIVRDAVHKALGDDK